MDFNQYPIFSGLSENELNLIGAKARIITINQHDTLIQENTIGDEFYIIKTGEAEIIREDIETDHPLRISIVSTGAILGEISIVDHAPRSASVRALTPLTVYVFSINEIKNLTVKKNLWTMLTDRSRSTIYEKIYSNISKMLAERLRSSNDSVIAALKNELEHTQARVAMGKFSINTIALICLFTFILKILSVIKIQLLSNSFIGAPMIVAFAVPLVYMMKFSGYPLSVYGLTTRNWRSATLEAILFTLPLLMITVLYKYILIRYAPSFAHRSIFDMTLNLKYTDHKTQITFAKALLVILLYVLFVPIQELIARGALQSSLEVLLISPHKTFLAIITSNLMFSAFHLYISIPFAITAFIPGLFWGWLYSRHRTLISVTASHLLLGAWAVFIVGIL